MLLSILAGCDAVGKKEFLTVDFQEAQTLKYKFTSTRKMELDWDPAKTTAKPGKNTVQKYSETMEMIVEYTPLEVDPYGLTTIKATCKFARQKRRPRKKGRNIRDDPAQNFSGKSFTFTVDPSGKINDYSKLDELIRQVGETAFRPKGNRGRIKDPDMIGDFIASQWFLWDSISSIENPTEGISVGQSWKSKLSVPTPMVSRKARDVTYTLDEIRQTEKGRLAVIKSSFKPADSAPGTWPVPYSAGKFRMSGTFGFLKNYRLLSLNGQGEEIFNIDAGRIEKYKHEYQLKMDASMMLPLGANPRITINQNLTMQLLGN